MMRWEVVIMKYNKLLKSYFLTLDELREVSEEDLNNKNNRFVLVVPNTKDLTEEFLSKYNRSNFSIQIRGGYTDSKIKYWNRINSVVKDFNPGVSNIKGISYYEDSIIYSVPTVMRIVHELELIEEGIESYWAPIKKALYVYDYLRERLVYSKKSMMDDTFMVRTLRCLLGNEAVCVGYSFVFKEVMDRLGIECYYVEGTTTYEDYKKHYVTHAWNLVKLGDNIFPLDLTWDASIYRSGNRSKFQHFSNLAQFKKKHFPSSFEEIRDYENSLSGIRSSFVFKTINSFQAKKKYVTSLFSLNTVDKARIMIGQLGEVEDSSGPKIYRYLWARQDFALGYTDYRILYTPINLTQTMQLLNRGQIKNKDKKLVAINCIFSPLNVDDSIKKGSAFVGFTSAEKIPITVDKPDFFMKEYPIRFRVFDGRDFDTFVVEEDKDKVSFNGKELYQARVLRIDEERNLTQYRVYSEDSLLDSQTREYDNYFLSVARLEDRCQKYNGYLGRYHKEMGIITDPMLETLFRTDDVGELTIDDIVPPLCEENVDYIDNIDPKLLYQVDGRYFIYRNAMGEDFLVDKKNNAVIGNKKKFVIAEFANLWCSSIDEESPYMRGLYQALSRVCIGQLKENGYIDLNVGNFQTSNEIEGELVRRMRKKFNDDFTNKKIMTEYFSLQTPYFKTSKEKNKVSVDKNVKKT